MNNIVTDLLLNSKSLHCFKNNVIDVFSHKPNMREILYRIIREDVVGKSLNINIIDLFLDHRFSRIVGPGIIYTLKIDDLHIYLIFEGDSCRHDISNDILVYPRKFYPYYRGKV